MFDPSDSSFFLGTEEVFTTTLPYSQVESLLQFIAREYNIHSFEDLLLIELPEGTFLKTTHPRWSEAFKAYTEQYNEKLPFQPTDTRHWKDLTRKYRAPRSAFGNDKLAMWKIGF